MLQRFIGLMSGTSLDGVDAALVQFSDDTGQPALRVLGFASRPMPLPLREALMALNHPGDNELHRAAIAANALVRLYADVTHDLLAQCQLQASDIHAIGAHGQTVRHRPGEFDGTGYTLQLNQPALLAEWTGIDVVADFRSRDVAAGGQGAPLVPPFHQAVFGRAHRAIAVLNIGGISNLTVLDPAAKDTVVGFDCGPGNALMDAWCQQHTGANFDASGQWARSGSVHLALLDQLLAEPFFARRGPKSTGRDLFNWDWLQTHLAQHTAVPARDVQATLAELTARSCSMALQQMPTTCQELIVCGGGAFNTYLMERLQQHLPGCKVLASDALGIPAQQVEAIAFAWLARQHLLRQTASLKSVTGARGARILGSLYPA